MNEAICLRVDPRPAISWEAFRAEHPPFSIALDGYVRGGPRFDAQGPHANFNHHEDVDRLATRATCAQVLMAIRQGLFQAFRDGGGARAEVWANDCDEDVCLSWALLKHHYLAIGAMNPTINRLVAMEDALDCTAGAYPYPADLPVLQELAWVFEPYRQFRANGLLAKRDPESYASVITDVTARVLAHITGHGRSVPLDTRYERIGGGSGWAMVRETGAQARTGMFADGVRVFVSVAERGNGRYQYTIGKFPFAPLDLASLVARLNYIEATSSDPWGGGDTIIGSPRANGSVIQPDTIAAEVTTAMARRAT